MGLKYGLPLLSPVDDAGIFTEEAGPFQGLQVCPSTLSYICIVLAFVLVLVLVILTFTFIFTQQPFLKASRFAHPLIVSLMKENV